MLYKDQILKQITQDIDISPSDFKIAQNRYKAVKEWLNNGTYSSGKYPDVYLQGSFKLGTVVRPFKNDKDGDFDIDQVCEISIPTNYRNPKLLKNDIGNRLKENSDYKRMLDDEGKRCWTLEYASSEGRPGFHLDVLPALPANRDWLGPIEATHKDNDNYSWTPSNPKGYYKWFKSKNSFTQEFVDKQRNILFETNIGVYDNVNDVPKQLLRTPLQRAIQILKRHRDVYFSNKENRPISVIITTIIASKFTSNNIYEIINEFIKYVLSRHQSLVKNGYLIEDGTLDFNNREWSILNPANISNQNFENFADKWNNNKALPKAFFKWVYQLNRDFERFLESESSKDLNLRTKVYGNNFTYSDNIQKSINNNLILECIDTTDDLLNLIHLGIENKVGWDVVSASAELILDNKTYGTTDKSVAKINYYQIKQHRNIPFTEQEKREIIQILVENKESSGFVMCCNLLLGSATLEMIKTCINSSYSDVLQWPILRLYKVPLV